MTRSVTNAQSSGDAETTLSSLAQIDFTCHVRRLPLHYDSIAADEKQTNTNKQTKHRNRNQEAQQSTIENPEKSIVDARA